MKTHELVALCLRNEGVEQIFGLIGDGNMSLWASLSSLPGINIMPVWHEASAMVASP
jgi:thiamine pyrophosphate-dependent acetolactate synthase large subunit-like protein